MGVIYVLVLFVLMACSTIPVGIAKQNGDQQDNNDKFLQDKSRAGNQIFTEGKYGYMHMGKVSPVKLKNSEVLPTVSSVEYAENEHQSDMDSDETNKGIFESDQKSDNTLINISDQTETHLKANSEGFERQMKAEATHNATEIFPNSNQYETGKGNCSRKKTKCPCNPNFDHCYFCPKWRYTNTTREAFNKTVCFSDRSVPVKDILERVDKNTTYLQIIVDNTWGGYYPLQPWPIDLEHISRLTNLESFEMSVGYYKFLQPYPLKNIKSFRNLTRITEIIINLPLESQSLKEMIEPLVNLERLNISLTRDLGMKSVEEMLKVVSNKTLKSLHMQTFQLIGSEHYSGELNLTQFLSQKIFLRLENLTLSENSLYKLHPSVIKVAPNLKLFDISGNLLLDSENLPALIEAILHPTIECLDMGFQGYVGGGSYKYRDHNLEEDLYPYTKYVGMKSKELLAIEGNENRVNGDSGVHLCGHGNKTTKGFVDGYISCLIIACINHNDNQNISDFVGAKSAFYKTIQCVLPRQFGNSPMSSNGIMDVLPDISDMMDLDCMLFMNLPIGRNLKELYFNQIHWEKSVTLGAKLKGQLCIMTNQLQSLLFTYNKGWLASAKLADVLDSVTSIHGMDKLEYLNLGSNNMAFNVSKLVGSNNFPNLKYISVAGNHITMPSSFSICNEIQGLRTIDMRNNLLNFDGTHFHISSNIASNCSMLEKLYLGSNNMTRQLKLNLQGTYKLKLLDLSNNRMNFLTKTLCHNISEIAHTSQSVIELNLTGNPLLCGCQKEALQFYKWVLKEKHWVNITNVNNMMCVSRNGFLNIGQLDMSQLDQLFEECFPSNVPLIIATVLGTVSFIALVFLSFATYRNRWKLKYRWFRITTAFERHFSPTSNQSKQWKYDAFVSYCSEDRFWVHDVLMKSLEEQYGFRLCIHYRDFPVGDPIPTTVSRTMTESREIIVVISQISLKSEWCCFELDHAILQAQRRKKALIVIKMGKFRNPMDNSSAAHVLDRYTYLEWPEQKEGHKLFWAKLIAKMYGDNDGCSCCLPYGAKAIKYNEILDENGSDERTPLL